MIISQLLGVKSDRVDGFILVHGFQVLQTAYPEARSLLDYDELDLKQCKKVVLVDSDMQKAHLGNGQGNR
jgi:hypothetical protein